MRNIEVNNTAAASFAEDCHEVEVEVCSTEHTSDISHEIKSSCVSVPTVKCHQVDTANDMSTVKTCQSKMEQICDNFTAIEPVARANTECRMEKVRKCPGNPGRELVSCTDIERDICGTMQTTVLVPDTCFEDLFPICPVLENESVTKCESVLKKVCKCDKNDL